jgi:hypothetical protein
MNQVQDLKTLLKRGEKSGVLHQVNKVAGSYQALLESQFGNFLNAFKYNLNLNAEESTKEVQIADSMQPDRTAIQHEFTKDDAFGLNLERLTSTLSEVENIVQEINDVPLENQSLDMISFSSAILLNLRNSVWRSISVRLTQHLLYNKSGSKFKIRKIEYVQCLHYVTVEIQRSIFQSKTYPKGHRALIAGPSYLMELLSRYEMEADELQKLYLSDVMTYLDSNSKKGKRDNRPLSFYLFNDANGLTQPESHSSGVESSKELLSVLTSNRNSLFFDPKLFIHVSNELEPNSVAPSPINSLEGQLRPLSVLAIDPFSSAHLRNQAKPDNSLLDESTSPFDPAYYTLFAALAILRVRAEADEEIRAWLEEQRSIETTIWESLLER